MVEIRPFQPGDVYLLRLQDAQAQEMAGLGDWRDMTRTALTIGPAWSAFGYGRMLGCAGYQMVWRGNARAWCLLASDIPRAAWLSIHRAVQGMFAQLPALGVWRVEAMALQGWPAADRWLRMLGFEYEGSARGYGPAGETFGRYARVTL